MSATLDPLVVRWDRTVIHPDPTKPDDETIVCCLAEDGQPVALFLDEEYREALGGQLVDPNPDEETEADRLIAIARSTVTALEALADRLVCDTDTTAIADEIRAALADWHIADEPEDENEETNR